MKASRLISELVQVIAQDGDRDVMLSVNGARELPSDGGVYDVASVRSTGLTIYLRDPEPGEPG